MRDSKAEQFVAEWAPMFVTSHAPARESALHKIYIQHQEEITKVEDDFEAIVTEVQANLEESIQDLSDDYPMYAKAIRKELAKLSQFLVDENPLKEALRLKVTDAYPSWVEAISESIGEGLDELGYEIVKKA